MLLAILAVLYSQQDKEYRLIMVAVNFALPGVRLFCFTAALTTICGYTIKSFEIQTTNISVRVGYVTLENDINFTSVSYLFLVFNLYISYTLHRTFQ